MRHIDLDPMNKQTEFTDKEREAIEGLASDIIDKVAEQAEDLLTALQVQSVKSDLMHRALTGQDSDQSRIVGEAIAQVALHLSPLMPELLDGFRVDEATEMEGTQALLAEAAKRQRHGQHVPMGADE